MEKIKCDVLICGGGVAGISAAVAAARAGANTILAEAEAMLGGTASLGLNCSFEGSDVNLLGGNFAEIVDRLKSKSGIILGSYAPFSISSFQDVCFEMLKEAKVKVLYRMKAVSISNSFLVTFETPSGNVLIEAKSVVDATGNGDVCACAGVDFELGDPNSGEIQPITLLFRMGNVDIEKLMDYVSSEDQFYHEKLLFVCDQTKNPPLLIGNGFFKWVEKEKQEGLICAREGIAIIITPNPKEVLINATRINQINALDSFQMSEAIEALYEQKISLVSHLKKKMPGFANAYVIDHASFPGIRETRRIMGLYQLTVQDIMEGREFDDCIARNSFPVDVHGPKSNPEGYRWIVPGGKGYYDIPLRCIMAKGKAGLFMAGRCISTTHDAHGSTRTMPCCIATGQAAGIGAALYHSNIMLEELKKKVQLQLGLQGVPIN